ncbi:major facilitator superfamily domain-containing protein, partial [Lobosporangium transversale]
WIAVLGSFLIHMFVFAPTEFAFGVFVLHYQDVFPRAAASEIAFVGTTGSAITYIAGFLAGIVADRFGFRPTAFAGTVLMAMSLIAASFSSQLWHLYVTQGLFFGVGASLTYYPAIAAPSQYFVKNRGLAIGIAVSGTGLGGFALAPLTNALISKVDVFWTLRILAIMIFIMAKNDRVKVEIEEKPSFWQALHMFKDVRFLTLTMAEVAASLGYLIPLYYMQTYAVYIGLSADEGALILGLSNGSSFVGRILLGIIADKVSNTKTLLFCCWATAFSVVVFWLNAKSFGMLLLMGVTFCMFVGAYISLVPVAVAESFG